jgi:tripartite-type tricarboxylate transporter receptor subunit TctC
LLPATSRRSARLVRRATPRPSSSSLVAPRNTPPDIIGRLNQEINIALTDPKITQRIAELADTPLSLSVADFTKLISDETEKWGKVIRAAGIKGPD